MRKRVLRLHTTRTSADDPLATTDSMRHSLQKPCWANLSFAHCVALPFAASHRP